MLAAAQGAPLPAWVLLPVRMPAAVPHVRLRTPASVGACAAWWLEADAIGNAHLRWAAVDWLCDGCGDRWPFAAKSHMSPAASAHTRWERQPHLKRAVLA